MLNLNQSFAFALETQDKEYEQSCQLFLAHLDRAAQMLLVLAIVVQVKNHGVYLVMDLIKNAFLQLLLKYCLSSNFCTFTVLSGCQPSHHRTQLCVGMSPLLVDLARTRDN